MGGGACKQWSLEGGFLSVVCPQTSWGLCEGGVICGERDRVSREVLELHTIRCEGHPCLCEYLIGRGGVCGLCARLREGGMSACGVCVFIFAFAPCVHF